MGVINFKDLLIGLLIGGLGTYAVVKTTTAKTQRVNNSEISTEQEKALSQGKTVVMQRIYTKP